MNFWQGDRVRLLTMVGHPKGTVTMWNYSKDSESELIYWIRLDDGTLIKDVLNDELELVSRNEKKDT